MRESEKILKTQPTNEDENFDQPSAETSSHFLNHSNFKLKTSYSIYFKVLINYAQMIAIIHSMDLKWPFYVENYLSFATKIGVSATEIVSFECIMWDFHVIEKYIHIKALIDLIIPFFFVTIIICVLIPFRIFTKKTQIHRIVVSFIVLSAFLQPNILQSLFNNISTIDLDNKTYLNNELTLEYYDENHQQWVN